MVTESNVPEINGYSTRKDLWGFLTANGADPKQSGVGYLILAVDIVGGEADMNRWLFKGVYAEIAKLHHVSCNAVDLSVRRVIAAIWHHNPTAFDDVFQRPLPSPPSPGSLIFALAEKYKTE